jgi:serralysin
LGHALGLKHGHEGGGPGNTAVPANRDALEFTVMTYRSYIGGPTGGGYTNEQFGYPQTFMMLDIAALQHLYGADYGVNAGNTAYTWSPTTGQMFVNGVGQGQPGANRVFLTIWDGGGNDTYDMSNYTNAVNINLAPGSWSITSNAQRANLGNGHFAQGNVYNALLFQGNNASLIENAIGGSGSDTIIGNNAGNSLDGGAGNDTLRGLAGSNTLIGGPGNDKLYVSSATDTVVELAGGGSDMVLASVDYVLTPGARVELLRTNSQGSTAGIDLTGNQFAQTIQGNAGSNVLRGGGGADVFQGFGGNDSYFIYNGGTTVIETAGGGSDTVLSSIDYGLAPGVQVEMLRTNAQGSTSPIDLTGNERAQTIRGNQGANVLDGRGGTDLLEGLGGPDTFVYADSYGSDTVADYQAGSDEFDLTGVSGLADYNDVRALMNEVGADVVIGFGGGNSLTIRNTTIATLDANQGDFLV